MVRHQTAPEERVPYRQSRCRALRRVLPSTVVVQSGSDSALATITGFTNETANPFDGGADDIYTLIVEYTVPTGYVKDASSPVVTVEVLVTT